MPLRAQGLSEHLVSVLKQLYTDQTKQVMNINAGNREFEISVGATQRYALSLPLPSPRCKQ